MDQEILKSRIGSLRQQIQSGSPDSYYAEIRAEKNRQLELLEDLYEALYG